MSTPQRQGTIEALNKNDGMKNLSDNNYDEEGLEEYDKNKLKSDVGEHFVRKKINGLWKAVCNYCFKKLGGAPKNVTSHLKKHFLSCKKRKYRDPHQMMIAIAAKRRRCDGLDGQTRLVNYSFDESYARRELAKMIVVHEYPLSMVNHKYFRSYSNALQPSFKVITRNTLKSDILVMYDVEKEKTMGLLQNNPSRIAITTDMWTASVQSRGYMVVTAHFIDDNWKMQSRIIRFIYVPCPHTAEVLANALVQCLFDWNFDRKLSTLTLDNCSTNDAMKDLILDKLNCDSLMLGGDLFHMRCAAHILNLIVKDGLERIQDGVKRIHDSVSYWIATPKRVEKFDESVRHLKIACDTKLAMDCKTRWNSTYKMLIVALKYKDVFDRLKNREPQFKCFPLESDWIFARAMCDRLTSFNSATELFSGRHYPTTNMFFPKICDIRLSMRKWLTSGVDVIQSMASSMIEKFDKYWIDIHGILSMATILDPRFKMKYLEYYYSLMYGDDSSIEVQKIHKLCCSLVKEYQLKHNGGENVSIDPNPSTSNASFTSRLNVWSPDEFFGFESFLASSATNTSIKSELELYLEEALLPRTNDFDILGWWKANKTKYPILSEIARDILAIPVTTVASESAFSTRGRILSPHRSRLHPDTLEALMCCQNWLCAQDSNDDGIQNFEEDKEELLEHEG